MTTRPPAQQFDRQSLAAFGRVFRGLGAPAAVTGTWRSRFVGPGWLRWLAPRGLWPLGLGGWCGKDFAPDGTGVNLLRRGPEVLRRFPIEVRHAASALDGKPCLAVIYPKTNPWPWPAVVDELRQLDERTLLGLTFFRIGPLGRLPLPFVLEKADGPS